MLHNISCNFIDVYSFSDDLFISSFPIGATLNIVFLNIFQEYLQNEVVLFSTSQLRQVSPDSVILDREVNSIRVSFSSAVPSLNGSFVLCLLTGTPDNIRTCGSRVNITITSKCKLASIVTADKNPPPPVQLLH